MKPRTNMPITTTRMIRKCFKGLFIMIFAPLPNELPTGRGSSTQPTNHPYDSLCEARTHPAAQAAAGQPSSKQDPFDEIVTLNVQSLQDAADTSLADRRGMDFSRLLFLPSCGYPQHGFAYNLINLLAHRKAPFLPGISRGPLQD